MSFVARSFRILLPIALLVVFSGCRKEQTSSPSTLSSQVQKIESAYKGWTVIPDAGVTSLSDEKVAEIMAFIKKVSSRKPGPVRSIAQVSGTKVRVDGGSYALNVQAVWDGYSVSGRGTVSYGNTSVGTTYVTGVTGISSSGSAQATTIYDYMGYNTATLNRTWTATVGTIASISTTGVYTIEWGGLINYSYYYNGATEKGPSEGFFFETAVGGGGLPIGVDPEP